jgi:hypothetical protein
VKYRASAVVLAVMLVGLPLSHLEIEDFDDSWLLRVDGRPVDVAGYLSERYTQLTRHCRHVQALSPSDPLHAQALHAVVQYSPPDSLSARIVQASRQGDWVLAQVKFRQLQDAVVLLHASAQGLEIAKGGVWSGTTCPLRPEPLIRRYLQGKVPAAPADLTACFAYQL